MSDDEDGNDEGSSDTYTLEAGTVEGHVKASAPTKEDAIDLFDHALEST